jgi:hypothetical protein
VSSENPDHLVSNFDHLVTQRKFPLQPLVGAHHLRNRLRWLNLVRDQRVIVHGFDDLGIA